LIEFFFVGFYFGLNFDNLIIDVIEESVNRGWSFGGNIVYFLGEFGTGLVFLIQSLLSMKELKL
jgi:hypothetical protein